MLKLQKGLFEGDFPLSQLFGENPQMYAVFGLKGHNGLDYAIPTGTKLYSCINGKVVENTLDASGYGNYIKLENEYCGVIYAHMKTISSLNVGSEVKAGDYLGLSDNTGDSTGPHLHFGIHPLPNRDRSNGYNGYIDPLNSNLVEWVDNLNESTIENTEEIEKLQVKVEELRKSRDEWKKAYTVEAEKNEITYTTIKTLGEQVKELQGVIATNKTPLSKYKASELLIELISRVRYKVPELIKK
jgi:murein DD-endopeptidase MepM/ murein hydrolase activator NlpD